jgi:hypothetical protein
VLFHDCDLHNYTIKVHAWRAFNATWHQPFDRPNTCFVHAARFDSTLKRDRRLRNTQKRGNSFPQESSHFYTLFKTLARNYQRKFVLLNLNPLEQSRLHRDCVIFSFLSFFFFFFFPEKINSRPLSFGRFTSKLIRPRVSIAEHIGPQTIRPRRSARECRSVSESGVSLSASCAASMRSQGPLVLPFFRSSWGAAFRIIRGDKPVADERVYR